VVLGESVRSTCGKHTFKLPIRSAALLITHRFTIARHADIIHVMEQGRMVESGCHDELLAQGGLYAQSWTAQVQDQPDVSDSDSFPQVYGTSLRLDGRESQIDPT
jgi:ABC-type glutathione transport system ATPase component